ncbi:MAG: hypothetical protein HC877_01705 [Thioploca sp.]|nr:hypothetical protein [Thioploca sp.]
MNMASTGSGGGSSSSSSSSGKEDTTPSRSPRSSRERRITEKESAIDEYLSTEGSDIEGNPLEGAEGAGR